MTPDTTGDGDAGPGSRDGALSLASSKDVHQRRHGRSQLRDARRHSEVPRDGIRCEDPALADPTAPAQHPAYDAGTDLVIVTCDGGNGELHTVAYENPYLLGLNVSPDDVARTW